jgi:trigger factor
VEIAADLDPETVNQSRDAVVKSLRRGVKLPGFRPGKAPLALISSRFADDIRGQLMEDLSAKAWKEVVEGEPDLQPVSDPEVTSLDLNEDGSFSLRAEIDVRPVLELVDPGDLSLQEISTEVSEADVDEEIEKIRKEQADWEPADDEPAEDGMRVECSFCGTYVDDNDDPIETEGEDQPTVVNEENAGFVLGHPDLYPEISEAMQGARTGDARVAFKRFDDNDPDSNRAGKRIRFEITIKSLKREQLPPVDDELATNLGLESLDELRQRISEVLEQGKKRERRSTWRRGLLDQLAKDFDINDLPQSLVQSAVASEMERFEQTFASRTGEKPQMDRQELATRFEPHARKTVLDMIILEQLAEEWSINSEDEVDLMIRAEAQQLGVPPAEHKANLSKQGQLGGLRQAARMAATTNELIRRAGGEVD